jgi:hypothetical protein
MHAFRPFAKEFVNRNVVRNVTGHLRARGQKSAKRNAFQSAARHGIPNTADWRITLKLLAENTAADPTLYQKKMVRVDLPEGTSAEFKGDAGSAIAEIMDRTNCHVQMTPGKICYNDNRPDTFTALDLMGMFHENSQALDLLPEYVTVRDAQNTRKRLNKPSPLSEASDHETLHAETGDLGDEATHVSTKAGVPTRSVWARDRGDIGLESQIPPRPKVFTALSMSAYISDLCRAKAIQRGLFRPEMNSNRVAEELVTLFREPDMAKFLSSHALNKVIDFLEKTSNLGAFRQLAQHLGNADYAFTASNWAHILAATAKAGDVHSHRSTVISMLRQGLKPTPFAWATLHDLVCRCSPSQAHIVADAMHSKAILHNRSATSMVARNAVEYDLNQFLSKGKGIEAFVHFYDNRFRHTYGLSDFNFLSVSTANRMVKTLLMTGRQQDALDVLNICAQRNPKNNVDQDTLRTLLTTAYFGEDLHLAITILQQFPVRENEPPPLDARLLEMLFKLVWQRRYHNVLKVVWRYACTVGLTTYYMENRMRRSLTFGTYFIGQHTHRSSTSLETRSRLWHAFAARIATGLSTLPESKQSDLTSLHDDALEFRNSQPATGALDSFKELFKTLKPADPLTDMLESAYKRDIEWKRRGLGLPKGLQSNWPTADAMLQEMMENAVSVPMYRPQSSRFISLQESEDARALQPIVDEILVAS